MKRLWILTAVLLITVLTFAACSKDQKPAATQGETAAPTDAPYIDTQIDEPEWTLAEGQLQLEGDGTVYAASEDVLYFAIVTNPDGSQELRFKISDEKAAALKANPADTAYFMTHNGEKLGDAVLNDDCTEAIITRENAADEITALATKIRGLYENNE